MLSKPRFPGWTANIAICIEWAIVNPDFTSFTPRVKAIIRCCHIVRPSYCVFLCYFHPIFSCIESKSDSSPLSVIPAFLFSYPDASTRSLSFPILLRIAANSSCDTATSAIWKIMYRA